MQNTKSTEHTVQTVLSIQQKRPGRKQQVVARARYINTKHWQFASDDSGRRRPKAPVDGHTGAVTGDSCYRLKVWTPAHTMPAGSTSPSQAEPVEDTIATVDGQ